MKRQIDNRRLLIVDDDRSLRQILAWGFADKGYAVSTAGSREEAVAKARLIDFDFALLDYRLPDGDGHRLSAELVERLPELRVVLMSADRASAATTIRDQSVAMAIVEKPVRLASLDRLFRCDEEPCIAQSPILG